MDHANTINDLIDVRYALAVAIANLAVAKVHERDQERLNEVLGDLKLAFDHAGFLMREIQEGDQK